MRKFSRQYPREILAAGEKLKINSNVQHHYFIAPNASTFSRRSFFIKLKFFLKLVNDKR